MRETEDVDRNAPLTSARDESGVMSIDMPRDYGFIEQSRDIAACCQSGKRAPPFRRVDRVEAQVV